MGFADVIDNWWEKGFTERSMRPIITVLEKWGLGYQEMVRNS